MKHIGIFTAIAILALPETAMAEEQRPLTEDWPELREFIERFSQDSQELLEHWMSEFGPLMESLADKIDDLSRYEPPVVLPNGDIIIRRKPDAPSNEPKANPDGTIDL